jgi:glutathione synthase/RimK-type ligase-like ATP-grasp enzyme
MATKLSLGTAEILFRCAQQKGLQPEWVRPNGLFAITVDGQERYVNFACSPLNSHTSVTLARDKYLTRLILERHELQNIPFARPETMEQATTFLQTYQKIIAKPVNGSGSRDIHLITDVTQLKELLIKNYILEQYITGKEMRYLILDGTVIGVHQSEYGTSVAADRALQRISFPPEAWDPVLMELSLQVAHILGLQFAAIDFLIDDSGRIYILEANATPGLKWFHAPTAGPAIDVAELFFDALPTVYGKGALL